MQTTNKAVTTSKAVTEVVTGLVRFSYANVFKPKAINESAEPQYSVSLIIPKSDTKTLTAIAQAIKAATEAGKSSKFNGKIPANLKTPLRDGDDERPDDEAYANSYFMNASAKTQKPKIFNRAGDLIEDEEDFYSGCYGRAKVNFYAFNTSGNRGIACGLTSCMKYKDGERLSGASAKAEDFDDGFECDDEDDF